MISDMNSKFLSKLSPHLCEIRMNSVNIQYLLTNVKEINE